MEEDDGEEVAGPSAYRKVRKRPKNADFESEDCVKCKDELLRMGKDISDLRKELARCLAENSQLRAMIEKNAAVVHQEDSSSEESSEEEMAVSEDEAQNSEDGACALPIGPPVSQEGQGTIFPSISEAAAMKKKQQKAKEAKTTATDGVKAARGISKSVPTVTTFDINVKLIINSIIHTLGHRNFHIKIVRRNVTEVKVCSLDDHAKLRKLLEEQKVKFFTYTPKAQKPFSILVKGIADTYDESDVRSYFADLKVNISLIRVVPLGGDRWLLKISSESDMNSLFKIKFILNSKVKFERFKRSGPTQCFKCQRFGHVSANCNMPTRCVKCGGGHARVDCDIPVREQNNEVFMDKDPATGAVVKRVGRTVKCVNCEKDGHTAGSRECPKRQAIERRMRENRAKPRAVRAAPNFTSQARVPGLSYAGAARQNSSNSLGAPAHRHDSAHGVSMASAMTTFELINNDCKRFLGRDIMSCLQRVGNFANDYGKLRDNGEKSSAILGMVLSLRQDG